MTWATDSELLQWLLSSSCWIVGDLRTPDLHLEIAFPFGNPVRAGHKTDWRRRGHFLLSVRISDDDLPTFAVPTQEIGGEIIPQWLVVGERVTDLAAVWYGKRFDHHGTVARGSVAMMPDLSSLSSFIHSDLPSYDPTPRSDLGIELNLNQLRPALALLHSYEPAKKVSAFWTASRFYANALRVYPTDPEMAFFHFVIALEVVASQIEVPCEDLYDEQTRRDLENIAQQVNSQTAKRILQRLYQVRRRVLYAAKHLVNSTFFEGTQAEGAFKLTHAKLEKCVKAAYDLRSKYVHGGAQFDVWLAQQVGGPTAEVQVGRPVLSGSQRELEKLLADVPTFTGLERLTRFVLLAFAHRYIEEVHPGLRSDDSDEWSAVWCELRYNLSTQPPCPEHPEYPHVRTIAQGSVNDVIRVGKDGVEVRSHRTFRKRFIPVSRFAAWWNHLVTKGTASLTSRSSNIPRTGHARVAGAILARCLSDRISVVDHNTIKLIAVERSLS